MGDTSTKARPSPEHLAAIDRVLDVLTDLDPAHAMLVCEDAGVALMLGLSLDLTTARVRELHRELLMEE